MERNRCGCCGHMRFALIDVKVKGEMGTQPEYTKLCDECLSVLDRTKSVVSLWDWVLRNSKSLTPRGVEHAVEVLHRARVI